MAVITLPAGPDLAAGEPEPVAAQAFAVDSPPAEPFAWRGSLRQYWGYTRGRRRLMAAAVVAFAVASVCDAWAIQLLAQIVDGALAHGRMSGFWHPATTWIAVAAVAVVATYVASLLTANAAQTFQRRLREDAHAHLLTLAPDDPAGPGGVAPGDALARLTGDVEDVEQFVVTGVVDALACLVTSVVFVVAAVRLRWDLALVVLTAAPLLWLVNRALEGPTERAAAAERRAVADVTSTLEEQFGALTVIHAYNTRPQEERWLRARDTQLFRARMRAFRLSALQPPLLEALETVALIAVLALGCHDIAAGRLTVGGLLAFATYLGFLYPPLTALGQFGLTAAAAGAAGRRIAVLFDRAPAVTDPQPDSGGAASGRGRGVERVEFEGFGSPLAARRGEVVTIVGASGAGKTTLAGHLVRFHDPARGRIMIDGTPVTDLPLTVLRDLVTLLPQEPTLIAGTLEENIAYGSLQAGPEDVRAAAHAAGARGFIEALPDRWRTRLGNRGLGLSGGERQRIALARALVRDSPVLVLDEPTTGLDPRTADEVLTVLRTAAADRITLVITHDLRIAERADRVALLAGGRIVAVGRHDALLRSDPAYAAFAASSPVDLRDPYPTAGRR